MATFGQNTQIDPQTGLPYGGWGGYNPNGQSFQGGPVAQPTQQTGGVSQSPVFNNPDYPAGGIRSMINPDELTAGQSWHGGSTAQSASQDTIYGPQDQFAQSRYYPYLSNLYDSFAQNPYSTVAGFDPYQTGGQQMGGQAASALQGSVGQTLGAYGQALDPSSAFSSPLYQNALQSTFNPFIRSFQQDILPGIQQQAVGVGQEGSSRQGIAQGLATQGLGQQMSDMASQFAQNAFNKGIDQRTSALGMAPQVGQFSFMPSQYMQDIGASRQGQQQRQMDAPFDLLARLQALMGDPTVLGQSQAKSVSKGSGSESMNNLMGNLFGGM